MGERGVIRNLTHFRQQGLFVDMRWDKITPTDVDLFIDFQDKLFVFAEAKHGSALPDVGQRLALERLCGASHNPPRRSAVGFIVSHEESGPTYLMRTALVTWVRWEGKWWERKRAEQRTLLDEIGAVRSHLRLEPVAERDPWLAEYEESEMRHWAPRTAKEIWS